MLRPPPRCRLFPYTTLFRSRESSQYFCWQSQSESSTCFRVSRDRKSTRLNSSHLVISYAVFCLKKKKSPRPSGRGLQRNSLATCRQVLGATTQDHEDIAGAT